MKIERWAEIDELKSKGQKFQLIWNVGNSLSLKFCLRVILSRQTIDLEGLEWLENDVIKGIHKLACTQMIANHITNESEFSVPTETIHRWTKGKQKLAYVKMIKQTSLKSHCELMRTQWAGKHISYGPKGGHATGRYYLRNKNSTSTNGDSLTN